MLSNYQAPKTLLILDFGFWILDFGLLSAVQNPKSKIQNQLLNRALTDLSSCMCKIASAKRGATVIISILEYSWWPLAGRGTVSLTSTLVKGELSSRSRVPGANAACVAQA